MPNKTKMKLLQKNFQPHFVMTLAPLSRLTCLILEEGGGGGEPRFFLSFPFLHYNNKLLLLLILFLYQLITVHSNKSSYLSFFMRFVFTKVLFFFFRSKPENIKQ